MDIEKLLKNLNISESKIKEIEAKPQLKKNIEKVFSRHNSEDKLLYTLACTIPKKLDIDLLSDLVFDGTIKHEGVMKATFKFCEKNKSCTKEDIKKYIKDNEKSQEEIVAIIKSKYYTAESKNALLSALKADLPLADFKFVLSEVDKFDFDNKKPQTKKEADWLDGGVITKLHKPGENRQINDELMREHLQRTGGKVVTRFPPEPNGILHIGHAKAINLNFGYAQKYGGITYLRYDDTNPRNEEKQYFDSILEDVEWLGYKPYKVTASSDYFDKIIEFSYKLIRKKKAYICELSVDEMRTRRRKYTDAKERGDNLTEQEYDEILSPFRNRPLEENLKLFEEMCQKKHREGTMSLRFKMDATSKNPFMLDLVGVRIIDKEHVRTKERYNIYPSYEFALCVSDSLEDVTHSFCTREFFTRQESYSWLLDQLEIYKPVQWEFSRLNVSNTVVSKRKLLQLKKYGIELDDPRLYTIKGMRRRGYPPNAINNFVKSLGLTFSETIIDIRILESFVRDELNKIARRVMCVRFPLKIHILEEKEHFLDIKDFPNGGLSRKVLFTPDLYIEKDDFSEIEDESFLRLTPNQPVGLYMYGAVKYIRKEGDAIYVKKCDETPKKHIHWVSVDCVRVELRSYKQLFNSFNPEASGDFLDDVNLDSKFIYEGFCDKRIIGAAIEDKLQFQRLGYFCVDPDTTPEKYVLNEIIPLKNVSI